MIKVVAVNYSRWVQTKNIVLAILVQSIVSIYIMLSSDVARYMTKAR